MSRSGADLALLLLAGFRSLADAATRELSRRGFEDVRPAHEFAMRAVMAGAGNASELGRRLSVSKQAAAKTISLLEQRGYVAREPENGAGRKRLQVTALGKSMLEQGEAIFDDLRRGWEQQVGPDRVGELENMLSRLVGPEPERANGSAQAASDFLESD